MGLAGQSLGPGTLAALAIAALSLVTEPARADASVGDARVSWRVEPSAAAAGCPDEASFVAAIAAAVHRSVGSTPSASPRISFDVTLGGAAGAIEGSVSMTSQEATEPSGSRRRTLRGRRCREVSEGLALIVALSIDPDLDALQPIRIGPATAPVAPPATAPMAAPLPASPPTPSFALRGDLEAAAVVATGAVPTVGLGALVGIGVHLERSPRSELALSGSLFAPTSIRVAGGSVRFGSQELRGWLCPWGLPLGSRLALAPCIGGALIHVTTASTGFVSDASSAATWVSASAGARAHLALASWLGVVAAAGASYAPVAHAWQLAGYGVVFDSDRLGFVGEAGVEARF